MRGFTIIFNHYHRAPTALATYSHFLVAPLKLSSFAAPLSTTTFISRANQNSLSSLNTALPSPSSSPSSPISSSSPSLLSFSLSQSIPLRSTHSKYSYNNKTPQGLFLANHFTSQFHSHSNSSFIPSMSDTVASSISSINASWNFQPGDSLPEFLEENSTTFNPPLIETKSNIITQTGQFSESFFTSELQNSPEAIVGLEHDLKLVEKIKSASSHLFRESESEYPYLPFILYSKSKESVTAESFLDSLGLRGDLVETIYAKKVLSTPAASQPSSVEQFTYPEFFDQVISKHSFATQGQENNFSVLSSLLEQLQNLFYVSIGGEKLTTKPVFIVGQTQNKNIVGLVSADIHT